MLRLESRQQKWLFNHWNSKNKKYLAVTLLLNLAQWKRITAEWINACVSLFLKYFYRCKTDCPKQVWCWWIFFFGKYCLLASSCQHTRQVKIWLQEVWGQLLHYTLLIPRYTCTGAKYFFVSFTKRFQDILNRCTKEVIKKYICFLLQYNVMAVLCHYV